MYTGNEEFVVYSKNDCSFCKKAKQLLDEKGLTYQEVNIEEDMSELKYFIEKGFKTVPQVYTWVGKERVHIGGYTDLVEFFSDVELQQNK